MPRPNRFQPDFAARLHQSRVARGEEQAPPAIPDFTAVNTRSFERMEAVVRAMQQHPSPASIIGNEAHSAMELSFQQFVAAIRAAQPQEPQEPQEDKMVILTQLEFGAPVTPTTTFLDVLHQSAADIIKALHLLRDNLAKLDPSLLCVHTPYRPNGTAVFADRVRIELRHRNEARLSDSYQGGYDLENYANRKIILMCDALARYTPVRAAIIELAALVPRGDEDPNEVLPQIDSFEEFFRTATFAFPLRHGTSRGSYHALPGDIRTVIINRPLLEGATPFRLDTPVWQIREQVRVNDGTYAALPTEVLDKLPDEVKQQQIPHLATKPGNAGMIAYTQSPVAGAADRQQVMKAGRYIRQHCEDLDDEDVKQLAAVIMSSLSAGMHMSHDPNEFARVYENGPSSCMAYGRNGKAFGRLIVNGEFFHPTRVYAHPDNNIRIAWLEVEGRIGARTLVNVKHKTHSTIYSSDSIAKAGPRLQNWLNEQGYHHSDSALDYEKLLRVSPDAYPHAIICPFIDPGNRGVDVYRDHLTVRGNDEADHETGCLQDYNTVNSVDWHCDCCGEGFSDDDERYYDHYDDHICEGCADSHYTYAFCADRNEYFYFPDDGTTFYDDLTPGNNRRQVVMSRGSGDYVHLWEDHYSDAVAERDRTVLLDDEDEYILDSDAERFGYINIDDGWYSADDFAVLDGETIRTDDLPDDAELLPLAKDPEYPMLPVYQTIEQEEVA